MQCVRTVEYALVCQSIKVILIISANLNASLILTVREIRHASKINALTPVLGRAVRMLSARLSTIFQCVHVHQVIVVHRSTIALKY